MALGRSLLYGVALLLLLAGCASMGNTLAQDIALEAYNGCKQRFPDFWLKRIDPNGTIWIESRVSGSLGMTEWQACIRSYYADLASQRSSAPPPPPTVAVAPAPAPAAPAVQPTAMSVLAPVWKRGDEWAYRYESPAGSGTYVWSVDREEAIDGVPHYVIKIGTGEAFYRKSDLAYTRATAEGVLVTKSTPSRLTYMWPMSIGQTWDQTIVLERSVTRQTWEIVDATMVEAEETVTVPAGTFRTLKLVYRNKKTGAIRFEAWYSPEVKQVVKVRENLETGLRVRELVAFKLR